MLAKLPDLASNPNDCATRNSSRSTIVNGRRRSLLERQNSGNAFPKFGVEDATKVFSEPGNVASQVASIASSTATH